MRLQELRKIKNKNVAQQNELAMLEMKECAESITKYLWLIDVLSRNGLSSGSGILVEINDVPDQAGTVWSGLWLSSEKKFYELKVLTNRAATELMEIESWIEKSPEIDAYSKGNGKTKAYIALELLVQYEKSK